MRLPGSYDVNKPYPVDMAGTGCAGGETTGSGGEYTVPSTKTAQQTQAILIGLSYVVSSSANPSCVAFTDDYVNSPEPAYINAVIDDVSAKYCVDKSKIFVNGYSSGAFETVTAGCSNADKIRGYGIQIGGGLRLHHAPCVGKPAAAMFVVGTLDTGNPIGPLSGTTGPNMIQNDSTGSAPARDEQLTRNGCQGNATGPWNATYPKCVKYTGCPDKYPVVWCVLEVNHGNGPMPMGADGGATVEKYRRQGMWDFYMSLPAP